MNKRRLGKSGIVVSEICMGTMTFGSQTDESMAHTILDRAYERGVDFYDLAEMYPVPPKAETFGITEKYFGRWLQHKKRDSLIIATKITGPGHGWFQPPVRHGKTTLDAHQISRALDESLKRLKTDYLDLYQIHWPEPLENLAESWETLQDLRKEGTK